MGCLVLMLLMSGVAWLPQQPEPSRQEEVAKPAAKPSLAEVVKAQQNSRPPASGEVRLIRNEDLVTLKNARVSTGSARRSGGKGKGETEESVVSDEAEAKAPTEGEGPDLQFWTSAFNEGKAALQTAVNQRMVLELRMNHLRNAYFQTADGTTREKIEADLAQCMVQLEQAREDERAALQAVEELRRQAAKAGLTPGQVRDLVGELPESKSVVDDVPQSIQES